MVDIFELVDSFNIPFSAQAAKWFLTFPNMQDCILFFPAD
jgi:hypothetical protein